MFDGGFQLGVTVDAVDELPSAWPMRPGVVDRPSRLGEILPVAVRSDAELAGDLRRIAELRSVLAGFEAELVVELASRRPAALDSSIGRRAESAAESAESVAAVGVSEFFPDELALIRNSSRASSTVLFERSVTLRSRLPRVWAALADGQLDLSRAHALADELGRPADGTAPDVLAAVEAAVLPRAAGLSIRRLRELARWELISRDAAAAERRRQQAAKTADVSARAVGDGMGELVDRGPWADTAAMHETVDSYARMLRDGGDRRPIGVLRHEVLRDLILRPWDTTRPPVTAQLTIDADLDALGGTVSQPGSPAPTGSVDGSPVTAAHLKELLRQLDALGVQPPAAGAAGVAIRDRTGRLLGTATLGELRDLTRRGCPTHGGGTGPKRRRRRRKAGQAAANAVAETLTAAPPNQQADSPPPPEPDPGRSAPFVEDRADCGCALLGKPEEVDRYRPSAEQRRLVSTRDRTCRWPGCHSRAGYADQDHVLPYDHGGATDCDNLCCLCRHHHRLKTHARGWRFVLDPDGTLHVTTPSGVTRVTRPPGLDPPEPQITGFRISGESDDDPPPF